MEYQYKAMKANGEIVEGIFVADQRRDVIEMLKTITTILSIFKKSNR